MNEEFEEFKIEILEMLERAEKALLEFDKLPENQTNSSLYDEVFRAYHNIKGGAGMMEWNELQHHVHQLENVLMQSKQTASIPKAYIGWFLRGNDVARSIIANETYAFDYDVSKLTASTPVSELKLVQEEKVSEPTPEPEQEFISEPTQDFVQEPELTIAEEDIQPEVVPPTSSSSSLDLPQEFFMEVNEGLDRVSNSLLKMEIGQGDKAMMDSLYRDIHSIKGACQLFGLSDASSLSHAMESSLEHIRSMDQFSIDKAHVSTLLLCVDLLSQAVQQSSSDEIKKEVAFMTSLLQPFSEQKPQENVTPKLEIINPEPVAQVSTPKKEEKPMSTQPPVASTSEADKPDTTIRVQVSLLDRLMTLMGEMVLVRNQVLQYSNKTDDLEFLNLSQKLDVVTSELQEETMKTRMQPIGNVLTKFQRVVRDLSGSLNKKINLNLYGVETELDKTLIEAVKDPLTHIVRNACDHGIETPDVRAQSGKSETGTITIKAYHEGGQVIVDITDDGKGLSKEKLINKALERGIIDQAKAKKMSDREVHSLIFAPGFSTAEKVTNVSGRGVGMDVVKSNIERIGGLVDIASNEGEGTKITLKIPLTLAIVPAMIIRSGEDRFAIPQVKLVELVRVERGMIEFVQGKPIYRLRGNILPLLNLKEVLSGEPANCEDSINIVVLKSETLQFGMMVDEIMDTADIVVKPLARFLKSISIYSGATVLGDGGVAFILDVQGIAKKHFGVVSDEESRIELQEEEAGMRETNLKEFVLIQLGAQAKHAIPLSIVSRMEEFSKDQIEFSGYQRVIRYRGGILRIVNLNEFFNYPLPTQQNSDVTQIIVAKVDDQIFGLEVDQIIDVLSTEDFLDSSLSTHEGISGNLVTKNEIIVVVNVEKIFEATQPKKKSPKFTLDTYRLLLVEDTDSIRTTLYQNLVENGYSVEMAVDGVEGLKKIAEHKAGFDLIISDIEMPRMNGYEFARKVRGISQLKDTPMIAFTTKSSNKEIDEAKQAGFTTFLEKSKGRILSTLVAECLSDKKRRTA